MMKKMFLERLKLRLSHLSKDEQEERISFYREMIEDRIEDGLTEEEAVKSIGSIDELTKEVINDNEINFDKKQIGIREKKNDFLKTIKEKKSSRNILLIVLGFPIWFPLLISGIAVLFSLYIVGWSIIVSLWAVVLAFAVSFIGGSVLGIIYLFQGANAIILGLSIACGGLAIFSFFGMKELTKLYCLFSKKIIALIRKEK